LAIPVVTARRGLPPPPSAPCQAHRTKIGSLRQPDLVRSALGASDAERLHHTLLLEQEKLFHSCQPPLLLPRLQSSEEAADAGSALQPPDTGEQGAQVEVGADLVCSGHCLLCSYPLQVVFEQGGLHREKAL